MIPVFMVGSRWSGSTLLRLMLDRLPEIAAPHPPPILRLITPLLPGYGDLSNGENFSRLVDDVCRLVELNPEPWGKTALDRGDVVSRCRERSLVAVHGAVYDICAEARGAKTWCCGSPANIHHVSSIENYFLGCRYIYIYRDGRDVAVTFRKAASGEKHFYHIAREWAAIQELALRLQHRLEPGRFLSISYEELVNDPRTTAQGVCDFLGASYREPMLVFHGNGGTAPLSDLLGGAAGPIMQDHTRTFLREAGEQDIRIFESAAGYALDALGYDRVFVKKGEEITFAGSEIAAFDAENDRLKDEQWKVADPADLMRRDFQADLLREIKARHARGPDPASSKDGTAAKRRMIAV